jgi:hypothetical protein
MGDACGTCGEQERSRTLMGKAERKRPIGRPKRRMQNKINLIF